MLKAQEWVHIRDGQDISLTSMATAAGLERRTFLRRFANATGMAPIEYCRAVRIARARELLEFGNTPQKEIAQSLGYKDVAAFARVFRKATGLPPGAYRKSFGLNAASPDDFAQKDSSRLKLANLRGSRSACGRGRAPPLEKQRPANVRFGMVRPCSRPTDSNVKRWTPRTENIAGLACACTKNGSLERDQV